MRGVASVLLMMIFGLTMIVCQSAAKLVEAPATVLKDIGDIFNKLVGVAFEFGQKPKEGEPKDEG